MDQIHNICLLMRFAKSVQSTTDRLAEKFSTQRTLIYLEQSLLLEEHVVSVDSNCN